MRNTKPFRPTQPHNAVFRATPARGRPTHICCHSPPKLTAFAPRFFTPEDRMKAILKRTVRGSTMKTLSQLDYESQLFAECRATFKRCALARPLRFKVKSFHKFLQLLIAVCLSMCFSVSAVAAQAVGTYAFVEAQALNLRERPDTRSSVIRTLPQKTVVSILERNGAWARVFVQGGQPAEGWLSARYLGNSAQNRGEFRSPGHSAQRRRPAHKSRRTQPSYPYQGPVAPLRVSQLDFDCRPALFGNSGIRKCMASARVQLSPQERDPNRSDHVYIACRGVVSYRTDVDNSPQRLVGYERLSISRDDRLGQSARVNFDVRSNKNKIISAHLQSFSCARD